MVSLRPVRASDRDFLLSVFSSTRPDIAHSNLAENEKHEFLEMQFSAQHLDYTTKYADAEFMLVLLEDVPIGRLYVHHGPNEIHILDIAILPKYRGQGIGTRLLSDILDQASRNRKAVRIYVEPWNPALNLYQRLGFTIAEDVQTHYRMEWRPPRGIVLPT